MLNGLEVHALEPGETALEAFILLKVLDRDGDISWAYRTTNRLSREELLGALTVQVDVLRSRSVTSGMTPEPCSSVTQRRPVVGSISTGSTVQVWCSSRTDSSDFRTARLVPVPSSGKRASDCTEHEKHEADNSQNPPNSYQDSNVENITKD